VVFTVYWSLATSAIADNFPAEKGEILITPLVHSSVQVEYLDTIVQIDPWGIIGLSNAMSAQLILVTDSPGHHLDADAIEKLSLSNTSVVIATNGLSQIPDGVVMANGDTIVLSGVTIEAIAAYDIIPGAPEHPKGDANGYVVTLGGKRLFFAGVTECVDEVKALAGIDVAFMPLNIPRGRMTPSAAAECTKILNPDVVYTYHYDQGWARQLDNPDFVSPELPGGLTVAQSLDLFEKELEGSGIEYRRSNWYPPQR
jgi:L-ascorbate metabolism protein UlaG (beta-lactamase superfamily)